MGRFPGKIGKHLHILPIYQEIVREISRIAEIARANGIPRWTLIRLDQYPVECEEVSIISSFGVMCRSLLKFFRRISVYTMTSHVRRLAIRVKYMEYTTSTKNIY